MAYARCDLIGNPQRGLVCLIASQCIVGNYCPKFLLGPLRAARLFWDYRCKYATPGRDVAALAVDECDSNSFLIIDGSIFRSAKLKRTIYR